MNVFTNIALSMCVMLLAQCGQDQGTAQKRSDVPTKPRNAWDGKTMVEILDSINRYSVPEQNYHMSKARANKMEAQLAQNLPPPQRLELSYRLADTQLGGGNTQEAIQLVASVLNANGGTDQAITAGNKPWFDLLAISHLRLGEQENCLRNHNAESCFVPLRGGGVYKEQDPSREAIALYTRILDAFPDDHQSKWLLNVAYMTVGGYPIQVPPRHLIPMATIPGKERFKESAMGLGIMRMGLSGGSIVDDFNNDGWLDVFCTSYWLYDNVKLYLNNAGQGFTDVTDNAGLKGITSGLNCMQADYDNDGDLDILVLRGAWLKEGGKHPNSLLRNNGDGTFSDVTIEAGLLSFHPTQTAAWSDFDLDGDLDVFIANESGKGMVHECEFYMNLGDGHFKEIAKELGLNVQGYFKGCATGDINNDGRPDLYLSDLSGKNRLFVNEPDGAGFSMRDIAASAGVEAPFYGFPCWFFDVDNDGWEDLFVSGYDLSKLEQVGAISAQEYLGLAPEAEKLMLYMNNGDLTFRDATTEYGLNTVAFTMGSNFGDIDNDGFPDMYLGTGSPDMRSVVPNRMFKNENGTHFKDVTFSSGTGNIQKGHGVSFGDIDQDGDQDIYCTMGGAYQGDTYPDLLLINTGEQGRWTSLDLEGNTGNRYAVGARIRVTVLNANGKERTIRHTVGSGGSFGANSLRAEIGLGACSRIKEVEIAWPDAERTVELFTGIEPERRYRIVQGAGKAVAL